MPTSAASSVVTLADVGIRAPYSAQARIFTWPFSVNLSALPTTLNSTCRSRTSSSINPRGSLGSISVTNATPFSPALIEKSF